MKNLFVKLALWILKKAGYDTSIILPPEIRKLIAPAFKECLAIEKPGFSGEYKHRQACYALGNAYKDSTMRDRNLALEIAVRGI